MSSLPVATYSLGSNLTALHLYVLVLKMLCLTTSEVGLLSMGVFLYYASIEFDLVNHFVLFHKLLEDGLPFRIVRFLLSWYSPQECHV